MKKQLFVFALAIALPFLILAQTPVPKDQIKAAFENLELKPWQMGEHLAIVKYKSADGTSVGSLGTSGSLENESFLLQSFIEKNGYAQLHENDSISIGNTDDAKAIGFLTEHYAENTLFIYRVHENNTLIIAGTLE